MPTAPLANSKKDDLPGAIHPNLPLANCEKDELPGSIPLKVPLTNGHPINHDQNETLVKKSILKNTRLETLAKRRSPI